MIRESTVFNRLAPMSRPAALLCRAASAVLAIALAAPSWAVERETVHFEVVHETVGSQSVYVLGDIPELGSGNPTYSVKLQPASYPTWQVDIAIPRGTMFNYRFGWRNDTVTAWKDPNNWNLISGPFAGATVAGTPYPAQKGVLYHRAWTDAFIHWRIAGTAAFTATPMEDVGPGRSSTERRWRAAHFAQAERTVEFYFSASDGSRDPLSGHYSTLLDTCFVQDGQVFDYWPPPTVSNQQQTNVGTFPSAILGENRPYRVLLPRGYPENTSKRYPVLYMHDGQNVFDFGPFGTWNADGTLLQNTRRGWVREIITVAIDNTENRARDYIPPDDIVPIGPGTGLPGRADLYAAFIISELKPVIDATYRTLPDRENTWTVGSSLGGVVSLYLGWDHNQTFGRCGPMSGSWWLPNFPARVGAEADRDLRIYLDSGDSGTSNDGAWGTMNLRDTLLQKGRVLELNLRHVVGFNQQHNEAAWAIRFPKALDFLAPAVEAENPLEEVFHRGDCNCDGVVDFFDIDAFVAALGGEVAWRSHYSEVHAGAQPPCRYLNCDADGDGVVAFFDIDPFVALLGSL